MLSSLAIALLPLILMLSGCGISKGPEFQATSQSQESQGQETSQSQESRQLLATAGNPIPQSECSYQCSKLGFHHGGKCYSSKCRCLVEHHEVKTLWNGWVSEGTCSPINIPNKESVCDKDDDPYGCDFPRQLSEDQLGLCGPPGSGERKEGRLFGWRWGDAGRIGLTTTLSSGKSWDARNVCELWALSWGVSRSMVERNIIGEDGTPVCARFADIAYACSTC